MNTDDVPLVFFLPTSPFLYSSVCVPCGGMVSSMKYRYLRIVRIIPPTWYGGVRLSWNQKFNTAVDPDITG